jgi:hypothetical protein
MEETGCGIVSAPRQSSFLTADFSVLDPRGVALYSRMQRMRAVGTTPGRLYFGYQTKTEYRCKAHGEKAAEAILLAEDDKNPVCAIR